MVIKDRIEQFSEDGVGFGYLGVNIVKKSPDCFEVPFRSIDDAVFDQYSVLNISSWNLSPLWISGMGKNSS